MSEESLVEAELDCARAKEYLKIARRATHPGFVAKHKHYLLLLDALVILALFCNVGALVISNALILKANPGGQLQELNPIAAKQLNAVEVSGAALLYPLLIFRLAAWGLILTYYYLARHEVCTVTGLNFLSLYAGILIVVLGYDFLNDLGYLIGVWL